MMDHSEKTYTVKKDELLSKLKENKTKHIAIFKDAMVKYKKKAAERLASTLKKVESGKKFSLSFADIPKPVTYEKEYDKVIGLLTMSIASEIDITASEYTCYVLDDWTWKQHFFSNTTRMYGAIGTTGPTGPTGPEGDNGEEESEDE